MNQPRTFTDTYWPDYYEVTAERPAWSTVKRAADAFGDIDPDAPRLAVDLGCGAGRDSRELLRRGWRVISVDMTCASPDVIRGHLEGFEIEHWSEKEEDGETALGEAHHFHLIDVVAVRRDAPTTGTVG